MEVEWVDADNEMLPPSPPPKTPRVLLSFTGLVVAKLPFVPFSLVQRISHRGLEGDDPTDCSMVSILFLLLMLSSAPPPLSAPATLACCSVDSFQVVGARQPFHDAWRSGALISLNVYLRDCCVFRIVFGEDIFLLSPPIFIVTVVECASGQPTALSPSISLCVETDSFAGNRRSVMSNACGVVASAHVLEVVGSSDPGCSRPDFWCVK